MAASISGIYSPLLWNLWRNLPEKFVKRVYLDVDENGMFTTPGGNSGRALVFEDGSVRNFLNHQAKTVCQWWMSKKEMVVVDPFSKRLYVVPTYADLHCNAKEIVQENLADYDLKPIDLGQLWVDGTVGEVGFEGGDIDLDTPRMVRRLTGAWLLDLQQDEMGDLIVGPHSYLAKYMRFVNGVSGMMPLNKSKGWDSLVTKHGLLSKFGQTMAHWIRSLSPEAREVLSGPVYESGD